MSVFDMKHRPVVFFLKERERERENFALPVLHRLKSRGDFLFHVIYIFAFILLCFVLVVVVAVYWLCCNKSISFSLSSLNSPGSRSCDSLLIFRIGAKCVMYTYTKIYKYSCILHLQLSFNILCGFFAKQSGDDC